MKILSGILFVIIATSIFAQPKAHIDFVDKITGMKFVKISSGSFLMGSLNNEAAIRRMENQHEVTIGHDFFMGIFEVTQAEWEKVMKNNPSHFSDAGKRYPVENINWFDVEKFINKLNRLSGENFRLPTEAEWEYACRAGTKTPFNTGDNLTTDQSNYYGPMPYKNFPAGVARNGTTPVGTFKPNPWGLYDMHGNVWEWCQDWYCPYPDSTTTDPIGDCKTELKVIRGGSWYFNAESARSANRYTHNPNDKGFSLGFRLVKDVN